MKAYIEQLLRDAADPIHGRNLVREYLQARILEGLQHAGAMIHLAFQGGTALRFLFAIPRYSEDLDFALEKPAASYDFRAYLRAIQDGFAKEGYQIGIKFNDRKTVHSAFLRFNMLLYVHSILSRRDKIPLLTLKRGEKRAFLPTKTCRWQVFALLDRVRFFLFSL